jgi:radical SAM protein with 4Fe4S-binding SPASM domain
VGLSVEKWPLSDLTLEITNYCLLDCMHCSSESSRQHSEDLPLRIIRKVVSDFAGLGGKTLEISGGEPLCRKELPEIIRHARGMGLETCLFSCGVFHPTQLTTGKDGLRRKVKELKQLGIDRVFVTLHGPNKEYHNQISRRPSFERTSRFIRELVREGIFVGVHFVPVRMNFDSIDDLVRYCEYLHVNEVALLRFVPQGRGKNHARMLKLTEEETYQLANLLNVEKNKKDGIVRVGSHLDFTFFFDKRHKPKPCAAGISKCLVTSGGKVFPCAVFKGLKEFVAGDVMKTSLGSIWMGSEAFRLLREFDDRRLKGLCKSCGFRSRCRGRCPAQRYYESHDLYQGPDPYCPKPEFDRILS